MSEFNGHVAHVNPIIKWYCAPHNTQSLPPKVFNPTTTFLLQKRRSALLHLSHSVVLSGGRLPYFSGNDRSKEIHIETAQRATVREQER
ncbi:hypothetical protein LOK49_LG11G01341 [Camellia lanceoleosa]|uniref:Uncharacterized protein n=1 Tax=Camellia lanceoleosa TaxID=1840588 RepID=A0ACC0G529_9ERIC|nr:hypothetical protein LOK49_LG11G01341 [Camellia lanceoleosa]